MSEEFKQEMFLSKIEMGKLVSKSDVCKFFGVSSFYLSDVMNYVLIEDLQPTNYNKYQKYITPTQFNIVREFLK